MDKKNYKIKFILSSYWLATLRYIEHTMFKNSFFCKQWPGNIHVKKIFYILWSLSYFYDGIENNLYQIKNLLHYDNFKTIKNQMKFWFAIYGENAWWTIAEFTIDFKTFQNSISKLERSFLKL